MRRINSYAIAMRNAPRDKTPGVQRGGMI